MLAVLVAFAAVAAPLGTVPQTQAQDSASTTLQAEAKSAAGERLPPPLLAKKTLSMMDGVPSTSVSALCYDADGFLMVGTLGGLARYDGDQFETFLSAETPGLDGDRISALHTDREGRTWVAAYDAPPTLFENGTFQPVCDRQDLHSVTQIHETREGTIWLLGTELARCRSGEVKVLDADDGLPAVQIRRLAEDGDGRVWLAAAEGLYQEHDSGFKRIDGRPFRWAITAFDGRVWALTELGMLEVFTGRQEVPLQVGAIDLTDDFSDTVHERMLATSIGLISVAPRRPDGSGLILRAIQSAIALDGGRQRINCILPGPGADLWLGMEVTGLEYVARRYVRLVGRETGQSPQPVFHVRQMPNQMALVCEGRGLTPFMLRADGEELPMELIREEDLDTRGAVSNEKGTWLSTAGGLTKVEGLRLVPDPKWQGEGGHIVAHSDGSVWMQLDDRVHCVVAADGTTGPLPSLAAPPTRIHALGSYNGSVVASITSRFLRLNEETLSWEPLVEIGEAAVRQVRTGEQGELWISTYGHGLLRLLPNGRVDRWSQDAGLPDPFLGWIGPVDADGFLWLNSNSGVLRVSVASLDAYAAGTATSIEARTFRTPEANGSGGAVLADGLLALPTLEGLAVFDRSAIPPPRLAPRVQVLEPFINDRPLGDLGKLHGPANLRLEFTAPIFPTSDDATFQYRLVGLEDRWVDVRNAREARYPNLGRGTYQLEVRARTPTSAWSIPVRSSTIEIAPRWHEFLWVRVLLALALATLLRYSLTLRTRTLARRNAALRQEIDQRLAAEARLRASEERFRHLFHTAPSAILSWSPEGKLLDRNARADELFSWDHNRPKDSLPWELFDDTTLGKKAFQEVITEEKDLSLDAMARTGFGRSKRCQWRFAPTFNPAGELVTVIGLISDFSRQDRDAKSLARLRESLVRAEESERSRIARELHDDLSQRLAALAMEAHMVDKAIETGQPLKQRLMESFRSEIEHIATDVHSLSRQLHPTIVDDLGLLTALRSECARRNQVGATPIRLTVGENFEEPPRETALTLFRIAQEATSNAARHSGASKIGINLDIQEDEILLTISDDGSGLDPSLASMGSGGIGMNSMRERARLAGGDLFVHSEAGEGTRITAKIPKHVEARNRALAIHGKWDSGTHE